jgi:hypothetical protein
MLHNKQNGNSDPLRRDSHSRSTSDIQNLYRQQQIDSPSNSPEITAANPNLENLVISTTTFSIGPVTTPNSPATEIHVRSGNDTFKIVTHSAVTFSTPPHASRSRSEQSTMPHLDLNQHGKVYEIFDAASVEEKSSIRINTNADVTSATTFEYHNSFDPDLINPPPYFPSAHDSNFSALSSELNESLLSEQEKNDAQELDPLTQNGTRDTESQETTDKEEDTILDDPNEIKNENENTQSLFSRGAKLLWRASAILTKSTVSLIAGSSSAINAGVNASKSQPQDISEAWWNAMSAPLQADTGWSFSASLSVNVIFAYNSISEAFDKARDNLFKRNQTRQEILENFITVTLGSSAAIASAAISYNAFSWTIGAVSYPVTVASLLINFTTRYVGVRTLINRFHLHLDKDLIIKNQCVQDLERIDPAYYKEVNEAVLAAFEKNEKKLDKEFIAIFATEFLELLEEKPDILKPETDSEAFNRRAFFLFEVVFACSIGLAALPTFTQKGFDGINLLVTLIKTDGMNFLAWYLKALVGAMPGIATAMLYTISALDFPKLTMTIMQGLFDAMKNAEGIHAHLKLVVPVMAFLYLAIANGFASSSMQNVAEGVFGKPDRIFDFISTENILGKILIPLNRIGGGVTNAKASFSHAFGKANATDPKLADVIKLFNTIHIDNRLEEKQQVALKKLAFFSRSQATTQASDDYLKLDTRDDDSSNTLRINF